MAAIKGRNTKPERIVRSVVRRLGYRFRLHGKGLPGSPDLVVPDLKKVVFVHGCFWHGHKKCLRGRRPSSNKPFWNKKLDLNRQRDKKNLSALRKLGWTPIILWECELKKPDRFRNRLVKFLKKS
jgi:DNA mismatch endonuclease (patch repair protein)